MDLLTPELRTALRTNAAAHRAAQAAGVCEPDPAPVVKFFNPVGAATWLASELDADGDTLFGLADLGFGCPELGAFSLAEIAAVRLPFGLSIERDDGFSSEAALSVWADTARRTGAILQAEAAMRAARSSPSHPLPPDPAHELPSSDPEDG